MTMRKRTTIKCLPDGTVKLHFWGKWNGEEHTQVFCVLPGEKIVRERIGSATPSVGPMLVMPGTLLATPNTLLRVVRREWRRQLHRLEQITALSQKIWKLRGRLYQLGNKP